MKPMRVWCSATIGVALVMACTALSQYEDAARVPLDEDLLYQDNINLDPVLRGGFGDTEKSVISDRDLNRALMMDKIMEGVQLKNEDLDMYPRSISDAIEYLDFKRKMPGAIVTKNMISKRHADNQEYREIRSDVKTTTPSQQQWNTKKGKGYPTFCYFKLCSFRTF